MCTCTASLEQVDSSQRTEPCNYPEGAPVELAAESSVFAFDRIQATDVAPFIFRLAGDRLERAIGYAHEKRRRRRMAVESDTGGAPDTICVAIERKRAAHTEERPPRNR